MTEPASIPPLIDLNFLPPDLARIRLALNKPNGFILCTGPGSCGTTTSLYSLTGYVAADPHRKTITMEQVMHGSLPPYTTRIPYQQADQQHLSAMLRSVVLAEPDFLHVDDIMSPGILPAAIRAGLTRQLVASEYTATSTADALHILLAANPLPYAITGFVRLIINQRLLPKLCESCRRPCKPDTATAEWIHNVWQLNASRLPDCPDTFYHPGACDACQQTGHQGRTIVAEAITIDQDLRQAADDGASPPQLRQLAIQQGTAHIAFDAIVKASTGLISLADAYQALHREPLF